jgi:hypothetical protein
MNFFGSEKKNRAPRSGLRGFSFPLASALLLLAAAAAEGGFDSEQRRCRDAIARGGLKLASTAIAATARCHSDRNTGRISSSVDCNDLTEADTRGLVSRARQRFVARVAGARGRCGGPTVTPARAGHVSCPSPCNDEYPAIVNFDDVAGCTACLVESEVEALALFTAGSPAVPLDASELRCHRFVTKSVATHHRLVASRRRACRKASEQRGAVTAGSCASDPVAGQQSSANRALSKISQVCSSANLGLLASCDSDDAAELAACVVADTERSADLVVERLHGDSATPRSEILWEHSVQPALAADCAPCHVGSRFGFTGLQGDPVAFSLADTEANRERFRDLISLDHPPASRLIAKALGGGHPGGHVHGGGAAMEIGSALHGAIIEWISEEKAEGCADCGVTAPVQYLAYVEQPRIFWALERDPARSDHGQRDRARILMQPLRPETLRPVGPPVEFLDPSFCGSDDRCDFGHLAASHDGSMLAFECRMAEPDEVQSALSQARWNVCIAGVGPDGRAVNPRLLRPGSRYSGETMSRSDPFGLYTESGRPLKGVYDHHFQVRRRDDLTPVFGPDDEWVYLSSRGLDPRTGSDGTRTYHGFEHVNNIIAVRTDGSEERSVYRNEGGQADFPFFRRNGNLVIHTWNLERMDRHLYTQATADGMMELPVLLGRVQGENRWGKAVELAGGNILGMTGRRRAAADNYVPFLGDHTLGAGIVDNPPAITVLDIEAHEQIAPFPNGYCRTPPDGENCVIDRWYGDPSYAPDGRAFIAHNPEPTHVLQGEGMYLGYSSGNTLDERLDSMFPYTPRKLGVWLIDSSGELEQVVAPDDGFMLRYPVWVGRRQAPRVQPRVTDETQDSATLHIADVPLWLSFRRGPDHTGGNSKARHMERLDGIVALRVLSKVIDGNACLDDGRPYRFAVNAGWYDHPTHLGINNATGYRHLRAPTGAGGNGFGDIPLEADGSVSLRLPADELLLFQGVDADGHVVHQHSRVFSVPPGHHINTSVKREQYASQCASCHGVIDSAQTFVPLTSFESVPFVAMDFDTDAAALAPVDLTAAQAESRLLTFENRLRPLLDRDCVSCHSGAAPAGELSLESEYSPTANYPAGRWQENRWSHDQYRNFVPESERIPGYNYSVAWSWLMRQDQNEYKSDPLYAPLLAGYEPVGELAPWDPAYQNLFANDGSVLVYLADFLHSSFGRSDRIGGNSSGSWLVEILSGRELSPQRDFTGPDHTGYFSEHELRDLMGLIDIGFPYMSRCDDRTVPSGPHAGLPWGDPYAQTAP